MSTRYDLFPTHRPKITLEAARYARGSDGQLLLFDSGDPTTDGELVAEFPADTGIAENRSVVA